MSTSFKKIIIFLMAFLLPISGICFFDDPVETDLKDYLSNDLPSIEEKFNTISNDFAMILSPKNKDGTNIAPSKFTLELMYRTMKNDTIPSLEKLIIQSSTIKIETMEVRDTHDFLHKLLIGKKDALENLASFIENNSDSPADSSLELTFKIVAMIAEGKDNELLKAANFNQYAMDYEKKLFFLMDKYKIPHETHIFKDIHLN